MLGILRTAAFLLSRSWENVREEFARHMHQPLCLALLRNCSPAEPAAFNWALRLLTAVLLQPKLRKGLKVRPCNPRNFSPLASSTCLYFCGAPCLREGSSSLNNPNNYGPPSRTGRQHRHR